MEQKQKTINWEDFKPKFFSKVSFLNRDICMEIREYVENIQSLVRHRNPGNIWNTAYETTGIDEYSDLNTRLHNMLIPVWQEAIDYYQFDVSFVEPYEVKKYSRMDHVGDHMDQFFGTADVERKLSMSIQLSSPMEYQGGNLKMLRRFNAEKHMGTVNIFPSFYLHEVTPVTSGVRYSINCWAWGPFWK